MEKYERVLTTKEETLAALETMKDKAWLKTFSEWVLEEYQAFLDTGKYPYLREVVEFINKRNGLDYATEGSELSGLVYNASSVFRERKEDAEGWISQVEENLAPYEGKQVGIKGSNILGGDVIAIRKVVRVAGRFAFMKPRARSRGSWAAPYEKFRPLAEGGK